MPEAFFLIILLSDSIRRILRSHTMSDFWDDVIAFDRTAALDETRSAIDEELASLAATTLRLLSRRNELAIVHRLPPELLARIFMYLIQPPRHVPRSKKIYPTVKPCWTAVTHVSRSWREIAVGHGPLWCSIDRSYGMKWIGEMALRAKGGMLSISTHGLSSSPAIDRKFHEFVDEHITLAKELMLDFRRIPAPNDRVTASWLELSARAPALEALRIQWHYSRQMLPVFGNGYALPFVSLSTGSGSFTGLRHLALHSCRLIDPYPSDLLGHIVTLVVHSQNVSEIGRLAALQLLNILKQTKVLENLHLQNAFAPAMPGDVLPTVELTTLHSIHLQDLPDRCQFILEHLSLPRLATVKVLVSGCKLYQVNLKICTDMVEALARQFSQKADHLVSTHLLISKGYLTWTAPAKLSENPVMVIKLGGFPREPFIFPREGIEGWLPILKTRIHVGHLILAGDSGRSALQAFADPDLATSFPELQRLVLRDMEASLSHRDLTLWIEERKRNQCPIPRHITLAGDPLKELAAKMREVTGSDGFSLHCGDQLVESALTE